MIFDWKNNREDALRQGIRLESVQTLGFTRLSVEVPDGRLSNCTFRNFPQLCIEESMINHCTFEDCGELTLSDTKVVNCTFRRVGTLYAVETDIERSRFCELSAEEDFAIHLEDSSISHCTFHLAKLKDGAYLCEAVGDVWIEHTGFFNIYTDRPDKELFHCEEVRGRIIKRKKAFSIVDEETCRFQCLLPEIMELLPGYHAIT